jgi:hypothetical protein
MGSTGGAIVTDTDTWATLTAGAARNAKINIIAII